MGFSGYGTARVGRGSMVLLAGWRVVPRCLPACLPASMTTTLHTCHTCGGGPAIQAAAGPLLAQAEATQPPAEVWPYGPGLGLTSV